MSGSYRQCSECGKRALSIATRCPGCGRELPAPAVPDHGSLGIGRFVTLPVALGVVVVAGMAVASVQRHGIEQPDGVESSFVRRDRSAASPLGATPRLDTATSGAATGGAAGELLVSRSWTNVRSRRSVKGELTAVLMPGDTVVADSLGRDWYRVSLEGEVMGYAHRSTLTR
jgi:hypothetical protein